MYILVVLDVRKWHFTGISGTSCWKTFHHGMAIVMVDLQVSRCVTTVVCLALNTEELHTSPLTCCHCWVNHVSTLMLVPWCSGSRLWSLSM